MGVYEKLMIIQAGLKAPKSQYNSFGRYKYRNCEDILEALKPLLTKVKALVLLSDETVHEATRFYIKSTAKIVDVETGDSIETTAYAREEENKKGMDGSQVTGCSSSYARKYALNGLFAIDDTKDSDFYGQNGEKQTLDKENREKLNEAIKRYSKKANKSIGDVTKELEKKFGKKVYEIKNKEAENILAYLEEKNQ